MTDQPPLAESMGRDSRSGSLQRLVSRSRELALGYFAAHPEAKADVIAKGLLLMREDWRKSHRYEYRADETKCWVCGESWHAKEMTRCTGFAAKYPRPETSIEGTIRREEVLYYETVKRSRALVLARFTRAEEVTGEALAELYHTHGCDSSIVEEVLDCRLPESVHTEFMGLMDKERARSRAAQKKEIITVRTTGDVAATANDLKLSDCPARRDGCAGEGGGAAGVTRGAVRSSAWLGDFGGAFRRRIIRSVDAGYDDIPRHCTSEGGKEARKE